MRWPWLGNMSTGFGKDFLGTHQVCLQPRKPGSSDYMFSLTWLPRHSEVGQRLQDIPHVSCEGTKRFKSWQFRNTVDVWGKVVFEYNPSIWRVLWFKGPGNRRHDWLLASTKTSLGFLKKRTKSDLYWLPDTRCKPVSKELLWRFMLIWCFVMMRLKIIFLQKKKMGLSEHQELHIVSEMINKSKCTWDIFKRGKK